MKRGAQAAGRCIAFERAVDEVLLVDVSAVPRPPCLQRVARQISGGAGRVGDPSRGRILGDRLIRTEPRKENGYFHRSPSANPAGVGRTSIEGIPMATQARPRRCHRPIPALRRASRPSAAVHSRGLEASDSVARASRAMPSHYAVPPGIDLVLFWAPFHPGTATIYAFVAHGVLRATGCCARTASRSPVSSGRRIARWKRVDWAARYAAGQRAQRRRGVGLAAPPGDHPELQGKRAGTRAARSTPSRRSPTPSQLVVVLAMEERETGAHAQGSAGCFARYRGRFGDMFATFHPAGIPGETPGKGSNEAWARARGARPADRGAAATTSPATRSPAATPMPSSTRTTSRR